MNKFMNALILSNDGKIYPVIPRLRVENFSFDINERTGSIHETKWTAKLSYCRSLIVSDGIKIPEHHIKDRLCKELSWQIYGDVTQLARALYHSIRENDQENSLELINALICELEGKNT